MNTGDQNPGYATNWTFPKEILVPMNNQDYNLVMMLIRKEGNKWLRKTIPDWETLLLFCVFT
jgi:hypothetical protein